MSGLPAKSKVALAAQSHIGLSGSDLAYAVNLVSTVCALAGPPNYLSDLRASAASNDLIRAVRDHDTPALFDWFVSMASFQGISDAVAAGYMEKHGRARWRDIQSALAAEPSCAKLRTHWQFYRCQYQKGSGTCAEPQHIETCPLPALPLRNGNLNQLAYSLFLFIRDLAGGDLVAWIDTQLAIAYAAPSNHRLSAMGQALIEPLGHIHGLSHKVLNMTLANLLLGAGQGKPRWVETGAALIAIDTLVHNFLVRTGILNRAHGLHAYGPQCYGRGGCADLLATISSAIDARSFNADFLPDFPRFVQSSIWSYCAGEGLNVCNGNRIDDSKGCENTQCRIYEICDRIELGTSKNADF